VKCGKLGLIVLLGATPLLMTCEGFNWARTLETTDQVLGAAQLYLAIEEALDKFEKGEVGKAELLAILRDALAQLKGPQEK